MQKTCTAVRFFVLLCRLCHPKMLWNISAILKVYSTCIFSFSSSSFFSEAPPIRNCGKNSDIFCARGGSPPKVCAAMTAAHIPANSDMRIFLNVFSVIKKPPIMSNKLYTLIMGDFLIFIRFHKKLSENFFSDVARFLSVLSVIISAYLFCIISSKHRAADHYLAVNVVFTQKPDSFLHAAERSRHKR